MMRLKCFAHPGQPATGFTIGQSLSGRGGRGVVHLQRTLIGIELVELAASPPPMGPGFANELIQEADRLEIWASTYREAGEDWTDFRLFRGDREVARCRISSF